MTQFEKHTSYRECGHEGVKELLWVTTDKGAYGDEKDGPLRDWIQGKDAFMEKVQRFDVVVQAGGNCGMYPRFYKNYFQNVYTFEPDPLNYYCLDHNCVGEGFHKFNGGVGNTTNKLSIKSTNKSNVGTHKIVDKPGDIQMYRIDDLNLVQCDLIHLDIEGYEKNAIQGALETIQKFKPVVIVERNGGADLLKELGYYEHNKSFMDNIYIL